MGTPVWAYVVYKKNVILGLSGSLSDEEVGKEGE